MHSILLQLLHWFSLFNRLSAVLVHKHIEIWGKSKLLHGYEPVVLFMLLPRQILLQLHFEFLI